VSTTVRIGGGAGHHLGTVLDLAIGSAAEVGIDITAGTDIDRPRSPMTTRNLNEEDSVEKSVAADVKKRVMIGKDTELMKTKI
jgi:hypothetical protein